jgi:hypothetical protein
MNDEIPYIDRYFNGKLSTEEKKTFEGRCLADPAFSRMVAFYISLQEHSKQQWVERKREQFAHLEAELFFADESSFSGNGALNTSEQYWIEEKTGDTNTVEERERKASLKEEPLRSLQEESIRKVEVKVRPVKRWQWMAVAATMLGVIAVGITLYVQKKEQGKTVAINISHEKSTKSNPALNHSSAQKNVVDSVVKQTDKKKQAPKKKLGKAEQQQLFAQNFVPDTPPGEKILLLEVAFDQYEKGNYKQASMEYEETQKAVESLTTRTLEDEQEEAERNQILFYAHYYNALSYLATGNTTKAIKELEAIKESPDRYWHNKQQWYLALAYLKTGEIAKTTTLLQQVAASKQAGDYRQKAIELRKALQEE